MVLKVATFQLLFNATFCLLLSFRQESDVKVKWKVVEKCYLETHPQEKILKEDRSCQSYFSCMSCSHSKSPALSVACVLPLSTCLYMPALSKQCAVLDAFHAHIHKTHSATYSWAYGRLWLRFCFPGWFQQLRYFCSISAISSVSDNSSIGSHTSTESESYSDIACHIEAHQTNRALEFQHLADNMCAWAWSTRLEEQPTSSLWGFLFLFAN